MFLNSIKQFSTIVQNHVNVNHILSQSVKSIQVRNYAARKGTRDRKAKKKVKAEVVKVGFVPHNQRNKLKLLAQREPLKFDDSWKRNPTDDVYVAKYYKWVVYPFAEAVKCHQETHSPEMYNKPNANLHVTIELNMQGEKKTRFVDNFTSVVKVPYNFDHGEERTIVVFSKNPDEQNEAITAGATLSGGSDLIKQIQNGDVSLQDFQYCIAHPNILPELVQLRGLMKKKFPNPKMGTLDVNLGKVVDKFLNGVKYQAVKDDYEKEFGCIKTVIGSLDMDIKHLEENFSVLINDVNSMKPRRPGTFIDRCILWSPPSQEVLKVDHAVFLKELNSKGSQNVFEKQEDYDKEEEEEKGERVAL
ncbi:unnamed protein product [Brassicogethes aeneus]|uniref:39S ribosomal protein L1, mitochondrial n=1 Tax=Brassicogethes aeneus TaxID=1431903 RepID=A0A9P0AZJ6_BRAAE|nr:unnamed protein product [Brassicogethes aeneus]